MPLGSAPSSLGPGRRCSSYTQQPDPRSLARRHVHRSILLRAAECPVGPGGWLWALTTRDCKTLGSYRALTLDGVDTRSGHRDADRPRGARCRRNGVGPSQPLRGPDSDAWHGCFAKGAWGSPRRHVRTWTRPPGPAWRVRVARSGRGLRPHRRGWPRRRRVGVSRTRPASNPQAVGIRPGARALGLAVKSRPRRLCFPSQSTGDPAAGPATPPSHR